MFPLPFPEKPATLPEEAVAVHVKVVPVTLDVGINEAVPPEQND